MVTSLRPWKRAGAIVMIATGLLLATSEAEKYAPNPFFWTKMVILGLIGVHALIFRRLVYKRTEELDRSPVIPTKAKVAAILSLGFGPPCLPWEDSSHTGISAAGARVELPSRYFAGGGAPFPGAGAIESGVAHEHQPASRVDQISLPVS